MAMNSPVDMGASPNPSMGGMGVGFGGGAVAPAAPSFPPMPALMPSAPAAGAGGTFTFGAAQPAPAAPAPVAPPMQFGATFGGAFLRHCPVHPPRTLIFTPNS